MCESLDGDGHQRPGQDIPAEGVWAELGIADDRIGHRSGVYHR
jgi:hypothetical protein